MEPRITFGMIVLNGEPFIRYNLGALYPFAHEIIVVEGASENAASLATPDGHSTDDTLLTLRRFKEDEDPDDKLIILTAEDCGHVDGFWPGEKDEQSRAYAERATGSVLWQVDVDEFYHPKDIETVWGLLRDDPAISGISFEWKNFWGGFDYIVDGWDYRQRTHQIDSHRRVFRWGRGYRYVRHRPPTVHDEQGHDLHAKRWIGSREMVDRSVYCYHYGMIFPVQARQKKEYYSRFAGQWPDHAGMEDWFESSFLELRRPWRVLHGSPPPSWLIRFHDKHPPAVQQLIKDLERGAISVETRAQDDIERVLNRRYYQVQTRLADRFGDAGAEMVRRAKRLTYRTSRRIEKTASLLASRRATLLFGEPAYRATGRTPRKQSFNLCEARSVLVVRLDQIGDVTMTTPFLRELRRNLPEVKITLVVKPAVYNLVELCPYVEEVLTYDPRGESGERYRRFRRHFRALNLARKSLWKEQFDLAINPRWDVDDYYATYLCYFSGAAHRVAYTERQSAVKQRRNRGYDQLLTDPLRETRSTHEVERSLDVIRQIGGTVRETQTEVWLSSDDEAFARAFIRDHGIRPDDLTVALSPGAGEARRQWPLARFVEIGRWIQCELGGKLLIIGGPGEELLGKRLERLLGDGVVNIVGRTSLRKTAALLKHCQLFVGNDSGPMHLAAAVGTKVVEISCHPKDAGAAHSNAPERFGPWMVPHIILRPDKTMDDCANGCSKRQAHCILGVTVDNARDGVETCLSETLVA